MPCDDESVIQYRLYIVANQGVNDPCDFEPLAELIRQRDPAIEVVVTPDEPLVGLAPNSVVPTLTFAPGPLRHFRPPRGPVVMGRRLPKSVEYERLQSLGIPVPLWAKLSPQERPDMAKFEPYVVVKPDFGAQGADIRIAKSSRLRWYHPRTRTARILGGLFAPYVVQRFIYTGRWPVSFRVATFFGQPLWCLKVEASHERPALQSPMGFAELGIGVGVSIVSSGKGCQFQLASEPDIIQLGVRSHAAFPEIGLLGVDIVRDAITGQLYVLEVNSLGYLWQLGTPKGRTLESQFGFRLESQFGGLSLAAELLVEQTRKRAG